MLGCSLDSNLYTISIYEKNKTLGRKFLVAGEGGLNLTHSENEKQFLIKYSPFNFIQKAFTHFSNQSFMSWLQNIGIETFIGTSGRVFPKKGIKPIEVLNTFIQKIKSNNTIFKSKHEWIGFEKNGDLRFDFNGDIKIVRSDYVIFCLGGASWPVTGNNNQWLNYFKENKIICNPFQSSNCAFKINWPPDLSNSLEGKTLKNCLFRCGEEANTGECVLTAFGIEGSGVYPLSGAIRSQLNRFEKAKLSIDLKPNLSEDKLLEKLNQPSKKKSFTQNIIQKLNLTAQQIVLIKFVLNKEDFFDKHKLIKTIKNLELEISGLDEIENAISTVGGIDLNEITDEFELVKMPNHFVVGEMLDYDAPTGGYLLQSCFSMGNYLAHILNNRA